MKITAFLLIVIALAACGSESDDNRSRSNDAPADGSIPLRVMTFNIEWGGAHVRFASISEAIRAADADIVGIQEPEGNLARLAGDLGWHFNLRNHVVSKYPLIDPPHGNGEYVLAEVAPGRVVAIANVHLPSDPYGVAWLRNGHAPEDVRTLERNVRLPKIAPLLKSLAAVHHRDIPVFLTGDFNSPSHADWTETVVGRFPHRDIAFEWPVSRAVADAGFHDSYRTIYPDPVTRPGFTWWAGRPKIENYNPSNKTHQNRIDFVWYAGPVKATDSRVVGEAEAPGVAVAVAPWPSDHRAVVSDFAVMPAPMPMLIATEKRVYERGESIHVIYRRPRRARGATVLLRNDDAKSDERQRRIAVPSELGRLELSGADLTSGFHRLLLLDSDGVLLCQNEFWILEPDQPPGVEIGAASFEKGEPLPLAWSNAPGNRLDWIGIFDARTPEDSRSYVAYGYVRARSSGTMYLDRHTAEGTWPLPPGRYVARLLEDDGFEILAESAPFVVE